jgi:glucokinase
MTSATTGEALGLDVGGTKVRALRVGRHGEMLDRASVPTPAEDPEATLEAMVTTARSLMTPAVVAVGVGAAGMVDAMKGILRFAPNIAWRELPIAERISSALGVPCQLDNDANAAAYGEYRFGAGRGYRHMLLVTIGTGIGGGIIMDGRLARGAHGFAAEIGHVIVDPNGPKCGCGNVGCWEQIASGTAIGREGRAAVREHGDSMILSLAGGDPERVTGAIVTEAGLAGDEVAIAVLSEIGLRLGQGIAGLANILDPQIVVVGGGAIRAGELILEPARAAFVDAIEAPEHRPFVPIVPAELGDDAGAVGAATLAMEELGRLGA